MSKSRTLVGFVLAGIAGLVALPASAQETVDLQLKLARGEVLYYARSIESSASFQITVPGAPPVQTSSTSRGEGRVALRVLDLAQDGTMLVESVVEEFRLTAEGSTLELVGEPALFRVRPDGKVVQWLIRPAIYEGIEDFPEALPGRPVRVGESWTSETRARQEGVATQMTVTTTLLAVESGPEGRVARLRSRLEGRLLDIALPPPPPGFQWRTSGTVRGTEEIEWLVDRGRSLSDRTEVTGDFRLELTGEGVTLQGGGTVRLALHDRTLSRESVTVTPPPLDFMIVPGKGIGPFTLDLSLADLNSRLGNSSAGDSLPDENASRVGWPNGLFAYVNPTDPGKVLGFTIADRRYRTDRGIGFGSSRGAVLFAYGMSPITIDVGGASLQIYDDQGIAFGITSDAEHARRGPAHAPIGAVDWVTVFPPGSATKIIKMP